MRNTLQHRHTAREGMRNTHSIDTLPGTLTHYRSRCQGHTDEERRYGEKSEKSRNNKKYKKRCSRSEDVCISISHDTLCVFVHGLGFNAKNTVYQ